MRKTTASGRTLGATATPRSGRSRQQSRARRLPQTHELTRSIHPAGAALRSTADGLLTIIAKLLDDAGVALESDRRTASACIARAAARVRAERNRDRNAWAHGKGALAVWQAKRLTAFIDAHLGDNIATEDLTGLV